MLANVIVSNVNEARLLGLQLLVLSNARALNKFFVKSVEVCMIYRPSGSY